jgi:RND superfamily putative drug exporter
VAGGLAGTGRLVTSAALILFLAFASLAAAPAVELKLFASTLAIGILLDATVVRALVVPALIGVLGDRAWWLPSPLRRLAGRRRAPVGGADVAAKHPPAAELRG